MLFNSFEYLLFLPIVFLLYWFVFDYALRRCKHQLLLQNLFVVVASYVFYGWWDWRFLVLIAITTLLSFLSGIGIERAPTQRGKKAVMIANIVVNLGILGIYKYYDFFATQFAELFGIESDFLLLHLILPVGISFYTFQALSYSIDVYRKQIGPMHDIVAFTAFLSFFPQLVAGPIERATNLLPQFQKKRTFDYATAVDGMRQILWGLFKKIVVADNCAVYVDQVFGDIAGHSGSTLVLAAVLFTFQIYGDFSGYSDIAIGTAKLFGIKLMRNFNVPYFSRDIAEFWRRWHISLTTWFRDYVYIPLGGSRPNVPARLQCKVESLKFKGMDECKVDSVKCSGEEDGKADTPAYTPYTLHPTPKIINRYTKAIAVRNTFIIFLLSGFWHGANWTFVLWGAYHALLFVPLLLLNKNRRYRDTVATITLPDGTIKTKWLPSIKEAGQMLLTFALAVFGWIIFRAENIGQVGEFIHNICNSSLLSIPDASGNSALLMNIYIFPILMKRFLIKTILFLFIVYGLAWGLDFVISKGLLRMDDYRFMSWNDMLNDDIEADVVILGNSRGFSHFEPWTIDSICGLKTYCLGIGGYPINVELLKYNCFRLYNKPRYIIHQVDYMTMKMLQAPHQHQSEQFLPLIYDKTMRGELRRVGYTWKDLYIPLYRYWGYQMVIKNGLLEGLGVKHYVSDPSRMGHHYERGEWNGAELAHMDTINATMDSAALCEFEEYMQRCQEESIRVILVNSPTYIGATNKTKGLDKVNAYFDSIASAYNTVYWNYNENYDLCNDTANFCVSVHMNPEATHEFSVDFARDLKEYIDSIE